MEQMSCHITMVMKDLQPGYSWDYNNTKDGAGCCIHHTIALFESSGCHSCVSIFMVKLKINGSIKTGSSQHNSIHIFENQALSVYTAWGYQRFIACLMGDYSRGKIQLYRTWIKRLLA